MKEAKWEDFRIAALHAAIILVDDDSTVYVDDSNEDRLVLVRDEPQPSVKYVVRKEHNETVTVSGSSAFLQASYGESGEIVEYQVNLYRTIVLEDEL